MINNFHKYTMKFLPLKVHPRLFAMLALSFVIATIMGTVSHELGHYIMGKSKGYEVKLHYSSVSYKPSQALDLKKFDSLYKADEKKILSKESSPEKVSFLKYRDSLGIKIRNEWQREMLFRIGGPLQTMITGTIGILLLWYNRKKIVIKKELSLKEWLAVILAFFWSRAVLNELICIYYYLVERKVSKFGDESMISLSMGYHANTLNATTCIVGTFLLLWVTFFIVPKQQRFSFILAGISGSALGVMIWFLWIGPVVLP